MLTRVTDIMKNDRMVHNLNRQQIDFDKVQNQLSTGKRIRRPGDDPAAAANQMYFRTRLEELAQFENNIKEGHCLLQKTAFPRENFSGNSGIGRGHWH